MDPLDHKTGLRRQGRIFSFQFLYHLQFGEFSDQKDKLLDPNTRPELLPLVLHDFGSNFFISHPVPDNSKVFARHLIEGTLNHYDDLEKIILHLTKNKRLDNIPKVDLTILLQATYELKYMAETPKKVIINESIELAKQFSSKESGAFVNGILDKIAKALAAQTE